MKKRLVYVIVFLFTMFSFSFYVSAASSITCSPKSVNVGDQITCRVTVDAGDQVDVSSKLSLVAGNTTIGEEGGNVVYKAISKGTYDVTIKSQGFTSTEKIVVNEKTTTTKTTTTTTKSKSDNNYLSSITIDGSEVEGFSKTKTKYFYEVEKVSVKAEAEDDKAEVNVDGPRTLDVGDNDFTISVKSENNTTKIYKVIVTRKDEDESSNTAIKSIKIRGYNLDIDKSSKTFYLKINKETTELDIDVKLKDKKAKYEIEGNEDLKDGSNIKIIVTAEDGTKTIYRIIIEKSEKSFLPFIIICGIVLIIAVVITIVIIKKKQKNNKDSNDKNDDNEKTKEIPVSADEEKTINKDDDISDTDMDIAIDNDEEEKTRILSYAERQELEKTKIYNEDDDLKNRLDDELSDTMLFNFDKGNIENEEDEDDY